MKYVFKPPKGLKECATYLKGITTMINLFLYRRAQQPDVNPQVLMYKTMIEYIGSLDTIDEMTFILSTIREEKRGIKKLLSFNPTDPERIENIEIQDYVLMVSCLANGILELNLGRFFNGELSLVEYEAIDKARLKIEEFKKKQYTTNSSFEEIAIEAMKDK